MSVSPSETKLPSNRYRYYVLFMLALVYAFSFMDRNITSILLGDLKAEFDLNDTQLGLLSGLAFALFYSTLAIPVARLADRKNRVTIITIALTIWSAVTAITALAGNFLQLLLTRIGVGVGEAGSLSPSHSVVSDYFSDRERSLALSLFSLGAALGSMMGLVVGGYVAENYGWRMAFVVAGLPGILLAVIFKLTVQEPVRGRFEQAAVDTGTNVDTDEEREPFMQTVRSLVANPAYRGVYIGHIFVVFTAYSVSAWLPQLMLRSYEVSQTEVGGWIGLMLFIGVAGGMFSGGLLATHFSKYDRRWQLNMPVLGLIVALPLYYLAFKAQSFGSAAVLFGAALFFFNMQHGPSLAVVQSAVKPHQRATAASLVFFASNLLGLGLGPLMVGALSDAMEPQYGDATSLAIALGVAVAVSIPAILIFYRTSRYLKNPETMESVDNSVR